MKVVQVIPSVMKGGAEKFVVDLCNEIINNGLEVYLFSLRSNNVNDDTCFLRNLNPQVKYESFNKDLGLNIKVMFRIAKRLNEIKPQIVHSHLNAFEYLYIFKTIFSTGSAKFYHTIHSLAPRECSNKVKKFFRKKFFMKKNHYPIVISQECKESFNSYYHTTKSFLIENGSNKPIQQNIIPIELKDKNETFVFINVGRIEKPKNQLLLAKAIEKINKETAFKCKALIIGNPTDKELVSEINKIGIEHVEMIGVRKNIGDYLVNADAFCLSSIQEGLPISLIEAISVGCIPVCTSVGGIPSIVKENIGILSEEVSIQSYTEALLNFIKLSIHDKLEMKKNCIKLFDQNFDIKICAQHHIDFYKN